VAAEDEAAELAEAAHGDGALLAALLARRLTGEPLAWVTGATTFCGRRLRIAGGVYVPRWQSEVVAERAATVLGPSGRAVDLGTGSGAIARVLMDRRPGAAVVGVDRDPVAAACARRNGVPTVVADLVAALSPAWRGTLDVLVAVLPYVPTAALGSLPREARHEPPGALDGGDDGLAVVRRVIDEAPRWLTGGGRLLLELGGDQPQSVAGDLAAAGLELVDVLVDPDGDPRGVEARRHPPERIRSSGRRRARAA
jgi:release factor glutamine methyltransferase